MYVPIVIFLNFFFGGVAFFVLLCFLSREVPLAFVVGWFSVEFSYYLLVHKAFDISINLNESLTAQSILGSRFFPFITLNISCQILLACRVSAEKSAINLMKVPLYIIFLFSLVVFSILSLCLIFVNLISMCLSMFLLGFMLLETLCASWTFLMVSFLTLGKISNFSYYLFKYFLRYFLSVFSFWDPYNGNIGAFNVVREVF